MTELTFAFRMHDDLKKIALDFLRKAERRWGERDKSFEFIGVGDGDAGPQVRFPMWPLRSLIMIEVQTAALHDVDRRQYQIAHEVIHMLDPDTNPPTIMLEEGLAVHASLALPTFADPAYLPIMIAHIHNAPECVNYRDALACFNELRTLEPSAIILLRATHKLHQLTAADIQSIIPAVSDDLARRLTERRQMR